MNIYIYMFISIYDTYRIFLWDMHIFSKRSEKGQQGVKLMGNWCRQIHAIETNTHCGKGRETHKVCVIAFRQLALGMFVHCEFAPSCQIFFWELSVLVYQPFCFAMLLCFTSKVRELLDRFYWGFGKRHFWCRICVWPCVVFVTQVVFLFASM